MAYANLHDVAVSGITEYFQHLRDFICSRTGTLADYSETGIGWTLHDSSYAVDEDTLTLGDWIVMYSSGEHEDAMHGIYIYIEYRGTSSALYSYGYNYWNNVTHAGTNRHGGTTTTTNAPTMINIYGDLDLVSVLGLTSGQHYVQQFGMMSHGYRDTTVVTCATDLAAGATTVATLSAVPDSFKVGGFVSVRDNTTAERAEIIAIDENDVTLDLSNSYLNADNIRLSERILNFCCRATASLASNGGYMLLDSSGVINGYSDLIGGTTYADDPWVAATDALQSQELNWSFNGYTLNILKAHSSASLDALYTDRAGVAYRARKVYSNLYFLFKEV